jgi:hypothetical protein
LRKETQNVGWVEPWVPFVLGPKDLGLEPRIKENETQGSRLG